MGPEIEFSQDEVFRIDADGVGEIDARSHGAVVDLVADSRPGLVLGTAPQSHGHAGALAGEQVHNRAFVGGDGRWQRVAALLAVHVGLPLRRGVLIAAQFIDNFAETQRLVAPVGEKHVGLEVIGIESPDFADADARALVADGSLQLQGGAGGTGLIGEQCDLLGVLGADFDAVVGQQHWPAALGHERHELALLIAQRHGLNPAEDGVEGDAVAIALESRSPVLAKVGGQARRRRRQGAAGGWGSQGVDGDAVVCNVGIEADGVGAERMAQGPAVRRKEHEVLLGKPCRQRQRHRHCCARRGATGANAKQRARRESRRGLWRRGRQRRRHGLRADCRREDDVRHHVCRAGARLERVVAAAW